MIDARGRIAGMLDRTADRVAQLVKNLSEEDVGTRPPGLAPIAWQVGHIAVVESKALTRAGLTSPIPETYPPLFDTGTGREGTYPPLAEMLPLLAAANAQLRTLALEGNLDDPIEGVRSYATVGEALLFLIYHRGYHIGKITTLRALLGNRLT